MEIVKGSRGTEVLLEPDTARRVRYVVAHMQAAGHELLLTEGYRPVGQPADQYVTAEARTSTGGSNQWFQWGRYQRGLTPSAAWPGTSRHGSGVAIDWNAPTTAGMRVRAEAMHMVGLVANVPSESWHAEPLGPVLVDLTQYRAAQTASNTIRSLIKEAPMWLIKTKDTGRIYGVTGEGITWLGSEALVVLWRRMIEHHGGNGDEMVVYQSEINSINASLKAAAGTVSPGELAEALADSIRGDVLKALENVEVSAGESAESIAQAVADELAGRMAG